MISAYRLTLRPISSSDLELLRQWRNSEPIRLNMVDQRIISPEQQQQWFKSINKGADYHFIAEYKEKAIGYANFKRGSKAGLGETGLYIGDDKYRGTVLAFCLALALLDFIFLELNLSLLEAVILPHNTAALSFNKKLGYQSVGNKYGMVVMELSKMGYLIAKQEIVSSLRL